MKKKLYGVAAWALWRIHDLVMSYASRGGHKRGKKLRGLVFFLYRLAAVSEVRSVVSAAK